MTTPTDDMKKLAACQTCARKRLTKCICAGASSGGGEDEETLLENEVSASNTTHTASLPTPEALEATSCQFHPTNQICFFPTPRAMLFFGPFDNDKALTNKAIKLTLRDNSILDKVIEILEQLIRDLAGELNQQSDISKLAAMLNISYKVEGLNLYINFNDQEQQQLFLQLLIDEQLLLNYHADQPSHALSGTN